MALSIKHAFVSGKPMGPNAGLVQGPHWDAEHVIAGGPANGTLMPIGTVVDYIGLWPPVGWLECAGQLVSGALYPDLFALLVRVQAVTITISNPAVISWPDHLLNPGSPVVFYSTGAPPGGIATNTRYYVSPNGYAAGSFRITAYLGGPDIVTTGSQSGIHTAIYAPWGTDGSMTQFYLPDLRDVVTAGMSIMGGSGYSNRMAPHGMGEVFGAEKTTLLLENLPSHNHGGFTGAQTANHTHGVSGSISGGTGFSDLSHNHQIVMEYWGNASGGGSHKVYQPNFEGSAEGTFTETTGVANLNHNHSVSGSFSGGTGIESAQHNHVIAPAGSGVGHSNVQPTTLLKKIIYAGG